MNASAKQQSVSHEGSRPASAEQRLKELGIRLPVPPEPFGIYAEAVQTGNLLFLKGMLPTEGRGAKFVGRVGEELNVETGAKRPTSLHSTPSQSRGNISDRSTKSRGSCGLECRWQLREMSAISLRSPTALPNCCKTSSEEKRIRAAWCMASRAFRSAHQSSWKSFSRWQIKKGYVIPGRTRASR